MSFTNKLKHHIQMSINIINRSGILCDHIRKKHFLKNCSRTLHHVCRSNGAVCLEMLLSHLLIAFDNFSDTQVALNIQHDLGVVNIWFGRRRGNMTSVLLRFSCLRGSYSTYFSSQSQCAKIPFVFTLRIFVHKQTTAVKYLSILTFKATNFLTSQ